MAVLETEAKQEDSRKLSCWPAAAAALTAVAELEWQSKRLHAEVAAEISCVSNIGHSDSTFIRLLSFSFSCAREAAVKQWATSINLVRALGHANF